MCQHIILGQELYCIPSLPASGIAEIPFLMASKHCFTSSVGEKCVMLKAGYVCGLKDLAESL